MTGRRLHRLTYAALLVAAGGLFMATAAVAVVHVLLLVPGVVFAVDAVKNRRPALPMRFWGLAAVLAACLLSVAFNLDLLERPLAHALKTKYFLLGLLSFFSLRACAREYLTAPKIRTIVNTALVSTAVASLSGVVGLFTGYNPLRMEEACAVDRACGMSGMLMTYAYGLNFFLVVLVGALIHRKRLSGCMNLNLAWASLAVNLVGFFLSYTRGAWLGFLAALPFFFFRGSKRTFLLAGCGSVLVLATTVLVSPGARNAFFNRKEISDDLRVDMFKATWRAFLERPALGWGYRNFEHHAVDIKRRHGITRSQNFASHAHNNYLELLASTGGLGALAFLFFCLSWMVGSHKRRDMVGTLTFPLTVSFMVSGMVQYTFGDGENLLLLLLFWAL